MMSHTLPKLYLGFLLQLTPLIAGLDPKAAQFLQTYLQAAKITLS